MVSGNCKTLNLMRSNAGITNAIFCISASINPRAKELRDANLASGMQSLDVAWNQCSVCMS